MRLVLVALFLAGQESAPPAPVVKIVSSLPRTGSAKAQTDFIVDAIRLAVEEAGATAGGFKVVYEDWDGFDATARRPWEREPENARRAVEDKDVMVYLGTYNSGSAKRSMPILNKAGLLMISPANTWPGLTKPGKGAEDEPEVYRPTGTVNDCRVVPADDVQGAVGTEWAKSLGAKRVAVLDDGEAYGKGVADLFVARAQTIGLKVLLQESIDPIAAQFRELMTKVKDADPDLLYFGGTTQTKAGQIAKDTVKVGLRCKLMVPDGCHEDAFVESAGAESLNDRTYVTSGAIPPGKLTGAGKGFVERFRTRYQREPEGYAICGYEAARVVLRAIASAGKKDRDAIRAACLKIRNYRGVLGWWSFDSNGDTTVRTTGGWRVREGRFEFDRVLAGPPDPLNYK
jgi:branched-chain amino acid transport system substrate-binding protein